MKKLVGFLALVVVVLAGVAVFVFTRPPKAPAKPHIVMIVIDTLRADHVGAYGYGRGTTPSIDALAARGTLFENVYPPTSWTVPSMASMFTGLNPQHHGIIQGLQILGQIAYQHQLGSAHDTLAERLDGAGYLTLGYSTNIHITRTTGFGQGFEVFEEAASANAEYVEELVDADLSKMETAVRDARPYFLYLHFFDPHTPYLPREPFFQKIAPNADPQILLDVNPAQGDLMSSFPRGFFAHNPLHLQALKDVYDSEVAACDDVIGRILGKLPGLENAYIMLVSDHGEAFSEHDTMLHGYDLFEGTLRVPLIIAPPSAPHAPRPYEVAAGRRVSTRVGVVDVMPTLLAMAGITVPDLDGVNLLANVPEKRTFPLHLHRGPIAEYGAIQYPWKVLVDKAAETTMLFNLESDPTEKTNLAPAQAVPDGLMKAAAAADEIAPKIPPVLVRNQHVANEEQLKSLGYLTGGDDDEPKKPKPPGAVLAEPTPDVPWVVDLNLCDRVRALKVKCDKAKDAIARETCVNDGLDAIEKDTCPKAKSYDHKKKCEFMRLDPTLRICAEVEAENK